MSNTTSFNASCAGEPGLGHLLVLTTIFTVLVMDVGSVVDN